ncbi:MAG: DUF2334 domain-containing protein [Bdellovibrionales bacterium]|nr:DUF2334 domain-containing protein [Bdellovibrionales bacterium]
MALLIFFLAGLGSANAALKVQVCVYFDEIPRDPNYKFGQVYSIMAANLLGHFSEVESRRVSIESYKSGDLSKCDKAIYIGSYYDNPIPDSFLTDLDGFSGEFLWMNYNIWQFAKKIGVEKFAQRTGFEFQTLVQYDEGPVRKSNDTGFYQYFHYKGKRFHKLYKFNPFRNEYFATPEIAVVKRGTANVLAEAEHNKNRSRTPYITENRGFFFVADIPFSFIHESDRYLIYTDVLFDFLGLPPRIKGPKYALIRLEDIHPEYNLDSLYLHFNLFKRRKMNYAISLIPRFIDPYEDPTSPNESTILNRPRFLKAIRYAVSNGANIIMHGYTHQISDSLNCDTGASGSDYEFWDGCRGKPLWYESEEFISSRLQRGMDLIRRAGLKISAWLPPHYEASPLAYSIFAKTFPRSVQRVRYIPVDNSPEDFRNWGGQFFPYTIEKDYYGQHIWPESLGNVNVKSKETPGAINLYTRSADQVVESLKLQSVIRDHWASFFWHPFNVEYDEAGMHSLVKILDAIDELGYQFVDLDELQSRGE